MCEAVPRGGACARNRSRPVGSVDLCVPTEHRVTADRPAFDISAQPGCASPTRPGPAVQARPASPARVVVTISLEGVRIPAVNVTLTDADGNIAIVRTISDAIGQVVFPDVSPGHYVVKAQRDGFADAQSAPFTIDSGEETEQVLMEMRLTFVRESVDVVVPANSPTESLQPVAVSDVLSGAKMDIQPLAGDDFQSLLLVLASADHDLRSRSSLRA